jgi:NADPH-dependent glutamate synthase beta subunit-like oxidoreductase
MADGILSKPVINRTKCNTCGVCVSRCPAEYLPDLKKEKLSLRGEVYRFADSSVKKVDVSSCQLACPIGQDPRGYIKLISDKKFEEALVLIRQTNALPSVTGYVCNHPCEQQCVANSIGEPASIKSLKRFVVDNYYVPEPKMAMSNTKNGKKVTIIGAGPAGLAAAYELVKKGYKVEIIEGFSKAGGMLYWAIPAFRLPREILNRDIQYITKMGVSIKTGIKFGIDLKLNDINKAGADAVIMAIGTHKGLEAGIENKKQVTGYMDCLTFLRLYAAGERISLGDDVLVIGGGNAAFDTARSARRCGSKNVTIVYRRSAAEMPADTDEVNEAKDEGIKIKYLTLPVRILKTGDSIEGLECVKAKLGKPDESGRRIPVAVKESEFVLKATSIISAVGQQPDLSWNKEKLPIKLTSSNTFVTGEDGMTGLEGVFAAGDCVKGPTSVVEAMADGKKVAQSVDLYLSKK